MIVQGGLCKLIDFQENSELTDLRVGIITILAADDPKTILEELNLELEIPESTQQPIWFNKQQRQPMCIYTESDERTLRLLVGISSHIISIDLAPESLDIVDKQFWRIRQQIHKMNVNDDIRLSCAASRLQLIKNVASVDYCPRNVASVILDHASPITYTHINIIDLYQLFKCYTDEPQRQQLSIYTDKVNLMDLEMLSHRQKYYKALLEHLDRDTPTNGLSKRQQARMLTEVKKIQMYKELEELHKLQELESDKYGHFKGLSLMDLEIFHLQVASSAALQQWIFDMFYKIKKAFRDISSQKDTKTKNTYIQLTKMYGDKLRQLSEQAIHQPRALENINKIKKEFEWFEGYHTRRLKGDLVSRVGYHLNDVIFKARKKSVNLQKVMVILMILIGIELFWGNSFFSIALLLVIGIFYLRH